MREEYTNDNPLRVFTAFSGYDSQCMALERLGIPYVLVGWSEIDKYAIQAHDAVYPQWADRNFGDISKIDWAQVPDIDLFTMSSPCFIAGTLVLTRNGYKPIEEIASGDEVLTHTCNFRRVIKPMKRKYAGVVYNLASPIFNDLTCTEEHPLYVKRMWRKGHTSKRTFDSPQWLSPKQIMADLVSDRKPTTRRYYIGYAINDEARLPKWGGSVDNRWGHHKEVNHLAPLFTNPNFWYVMGRYVGDGWRRESKCGNGVIICCGGRNEERFMSAFAELGWHFHVVKERTVRKYTISMNELYAFVERYGYYAHSKRIDAETMNLPKELLTGFVEGMVESDGCFIDGIYKITSVSKELVYGLGQCIAKVYNRPFSIYKTLRPKKTMIEGRLVNQRDSWTISWKLNNDAQDKAFYEDGYIWAPINKVEWANKCCVVYNMEVDVDNSYTANGAIVHNCQDFSIAGLQKGGNEGSGTRSSLLWECRKAILPKKPRYILFENVKALVSKKFLPSFRKWQDELSKRGYSNFVKVLNSKCYGIPQNRERVFMVSILDEDASFHFPEPFPLKKRLKDVLEEEVDERYYLKDDAVSGIMGNLEAGELDESRHNMTDLVPREDGISNTITSIEKDNLLSESVSSKSVAEELKKIAEAARKEKIEVTIDGEGNLRPHRMDKKKSGCSEFQTENESSIASTCISARPNMVYGESTSFRIRKLSEREVFRLMDVSEDDIDRIQAAGISRSQQYKMAGNSICTGVLFHIFRKLFIETECESKQLSLF